MKVLVVGGAGYVGSVLVEELLMRGYAVRVFDRLYFGDIGLKSVMDRIDLVVGDMRVLPDDILDDIEAIICVGGLSNDPTAEFNPEANYQINTIATRSLAEMCKDKGVSKFIFASSCSMYDRGVIDTIDMVQDEESIVEPKAIYSISKYDAERALLELADDNFCVVILRKGTIYGFSPRMRYDLVVNTFVAHALNRGKITVFYGGEMWRPLVDIRDVARAYITCLTVDEALVSGQIFNISYGDYRISELAFRVRSALSEIGIDVQIDVDYEYRGVRSYRVCANKARMTLGYVPKISIEDSVKTMVRQIQKYGYEDFGNPRYYNIRWMKLLEEAKKIIDVTGEVF